MNRDKLIQNGYEDVVVFENLSFDEALIGVSSDNRAVYDYTLMIECLVKEEEMTCEEAVDWISYNTLRSLPYQKNAPIVIHKFEE